MDRELDGSAITSVDEFHREIARVLDFGPSYGRNLDALWDSLTADQSRPLTLVWRHASASRRAMGWREYRRVSKVLREVAKKDARFHVSFVD